MKITLNLVLLCFMTLLFIACNSKKNNTTKTALYQCPMKCEGEKTFENQRSCAVCKMDLQPLSSLSKSKVVSTEISETSIFNLTSEWHTQNNNKIQLKDLKGKTLVMVMIYTSCKAACPRLVADMRNIEKQIPKELIPNINFVMISIDPKTDSPARLKAFAKENLMDAEQWTFLQGSVSGTREFANVLAVKYKEITPLDFSHSNIISVYNKEGELAHQQEGLGVDNQQTVAAIIANTK